MDQFYLTLYMHITCLGNSVLQVYTVQSMFIVKGKTHTCKLDFGLHTAHHCISFKVKAFINIAGVKIKLTSKKIAF